VKVEIPLQAYFRINSENMGQFERTLIIAEEGSSVHYVEGCTAPVFTSNTLHSAVVEIVVKKNADVRYTTIRNWSHNVYNLVTKRAVVQEGGRMTWIDANLGSKVTMKYPSVYLVGERAHGEVLSVAFAGSDQHQDAGAKMIHAAPNTTSIIQSKGISKGTGQQTYRGMVKIYPGAHGAKSTVRCDALILDQKTVEQHSLRRGEPDWLRESRLHALERFTPESWPSGEEEEWRRFPLSGLPTGPIASTLDHLPGIQFKLEPDAIAAGVIFKGLTRAALDNPQLVRPHITNGDGISSHAAFRAAADALWSAGSTFVHVPAGVEVRQPLVLDKAWPASDEAMLSRTILVAERDSSVVLVEDLSSEGEAPRLAIPHVEVHVGAGARVWYVGIRRWAPGVLDLGFQRFR